MSPNIPPLLRTRALLASAASLSLLVLVACGGGGGGATPAVVPAPPAVTPAAPVPPPVPPVVTPVPPVVTPVPPVVTPTPPVEGATIVVTRADLGQMIFNDTNLSEPHGTACVNCHQAKQGFSSTNGSSTGVALGSLPGSLGLRKPLNNSYAGFVPPFAFIFNENNEFVASGGLFWDGRADTPALQALGPFLNPLEMNNASRKAVVDKIAAASYASLFKQEFGAGIFNDTDAAYIQIGVAIDTFERSKLQPFTSKFDAVLRGQATFTVSEWRGSAMFQYESKGNCSTCHFIDPLSDRPEDSLFTDFSYRTTGVPRNPLIPRNFDPNFFDLGLCGPERAPPALPAFAPAGVTIDDFCGKFRVPTLRNVAERPAFMHNGFFKDLREVVKFYSGRNVGTVSDDLPAKYQRNIERTIAPFNRAAHTGPAMSDSEIDDVVAFLRTLSDGYTPP